MECRACHQSKTAIEFKKAGRYLDTICKSCYNIRNRTYTKAYTNTAHGWANRSWQRLVSRANNRDGRHPTYVNVDVRMTKNEFLEWAIPRYKEWIETHFAYEIPTIDRIDSTAHYEIMNIRILSKSDNSMRSGKPDTVHQLVRYVVRYANKLGISPESVAELIIKEQK